MNSLSSATQSSATQSSATQSSATQSSATQSSATQSSEDSSQGYFRWCTTCGVACNSDIVFQTHVRGRRHIRNESKRGGAGQFLVQQRSLYRTLTPFRSGPSGSRNGRFRLQSHGTRSMLEYQMPDVNGTSYVNKGYDILSDIAAAAKIPISMQTSQCPFDELKEGCEQSENGRDILWRLSSSGTQCYKTELRVGHDMFVARGVSANDTCRRVVTSALNVLLSDFDAVSSSDSSPTGKSESLSSTNASRTDSLATNGSVLGDTKADGCPADEYVSATVAQLDYLRTKPAEPHLEIQKQLMKHLNAPVAQRHGLHSLADMIGRKLRHLSGSLAKQCHEKSGPSSSDESPILNCCSYHSSFGLPSRPYKPMPSKLSAISLLPSDPVLVKYARLVYAVRVGAYASNVINIHDHAIRMIVMCDSFYRNASVWEPALATAKRESETLTSPSAADAFLDTIVAAILSSDGESPTASGGVPPLDVRKVEEQGMVIVKQNVCLNEECYEFVCEVSFLGMGDADDKLVGEIQQQLWMNTHFSPIQRTAVSALRILRNMSRYPSFKVDFVSLYDWAKLLNQTVIYLENRITSQAPKEWRKTLWDSLMCPVSICCELFRRLAGGALLHPLLHPCVPCSRSSARRLGKITAPWPNDSECGFRYSDHLCEHLSQEERVRMTVGAQYIVNEVINGEFSNGNLDILNVLLPSC